jgi:hypothetical protein
MFFNAPMILQKVFSRNSCICLVAVALAVCFVVVKLAVCFEAFVAELEVYVVAVKLAVYLHQ